MQVQCRGLQQEEALQPTTGSLPEGPTLSELSEADVLFSVSYLVIGERASSTGQTQGLSFC